LPFPPSYALLKTMGLRPSDGTETAAGICSRVCLAANAAGDGDGLRADKAIRRTQHGIDPLFANIVTNGRRAENVKVL
jgi:hypothetical protein